MLDMASNQKKKPTGFLDLPLELRQMVYEQLYPAKDRVHLGKPPSRAECDIKRFCQADPRVREEIISWESKRYSMVGFKVTPDPWHQPEHFDYENLEWIVILIDHYDIYVDQIEDQLDDMRTNMEKIVATIATYQRRNRILPKIYVKFHQEPTEDGKGDLHWCKSLSGGNLLDTVDGTLNTNPIFTYLLEPLLELPTCQMAHVKPLENISSYGFRWSAPDPLNLVDEDLDHDHWYAKSFCAVMEAWLEGRISRAAPFTTLWNSYRRASLRGWRDPIYESMRPVFFNRGIPLPTKPGNRFPLF